jgi:hypothetical protein
LDCIAEQQPRVLSVLLQWQCVPGFNRPSGVRLFGPLRSRMIGALCPALKAGRIFTAFEAIED